MNPEPPGNRGPGQVQATSAQERLHIRRVRGEMVAIRHAPGQSFRFWVIPDWLSDLFEVDAK